MNKAYDKKLSDPRWQKKRLLIFQRDNFTCQNSKCGNNEIELQVHHLEYLGNLEPWEYSDDMLITLCAIYHEKERGREEIERQVLLTLRMNGFLYDDLLAFSSAIDMNKLFCKYILNHIRKIKNG